jgi:hypothetical protein
MLSPGRVAATAAGGNGGDRAFPAAFGVPSTDFATHFLRCSNANTFARCTFRSPRADCSIFLFD